MGTLALAFRLMRRELRGGLRGFRIFTLCLALGVAAIAGVGSLAAAIEAGLAHDAGALVGGDVEFNLVYREADAAQRQFFDNAGGLSEVAHMRAMARSADDAQRSLIELKAIDDAYPLYGAVTIAPAQPLAGALALKDGRWGAIVEAGLLDRLGARVGDTVRIGDAALELRGVVTHEPDAAGFLELGPRVMVARGALAATGLVAPGTLITYSYRLRLPRGVDPQRFADAARQRFSDAGWRIRTIKSAAPGLQRLLDRLSVYLTLVGLTALLIGGVGVGNSVKAFLDGKIATIATFKCLGAPRRLVFATYLSQVLALALGGIALGLVLGAAVPYALTPLLPAQLPVAAVLGVYPRPLLLGTAFGLLTTFAFALWPIAAASEVSAASLFRSAAEPLTARPRARYVLAVASAVLALAAVAVASAADRMVALWFILGAAGTLATLRAAAWALMAGARRAGRPRHAGLRLALANLYRPGAPTGGIVASLGLGLTVLVAVALLEGNLSREIGERLPEEAPSFFFIDIQPDQVALFDGILAGEPGVVELARVPSLRGRIARINGVPVEEAHVAADAQWAIRSERGLTYSATPPKGSRIVAGAWWPQDYRGEPLLSFDSELAHGMGLKLGDSLSVNVLGREVTAKIANLREIDWRSLGLNFALVFSPGVLDGAPQTWMATARVPDGGEALLERAVTDRLPNVSAIRVKDALAAVAEIIAAVAAAVRATAALTLVAGALVLAGAVAAEHRHRVYQAVVLKVLGASRRQVTQSFLIEYGILGLAAAAIAAVAGSIAAWLLLTRVMHADWVFLPGGVVLTAVLATLLTLALGYAGTWRALGAKAAPYLRNE